MERGTSSTLATWFRPLWWVVALYAVVFATATYTFLIPDATSDVIESYVAYFPLHLANLWLVSVARRRLAALYPTWDSSLRWIQASLALWVLADAAYTWVYDIQGAPPNQESFGDFFYVLGDLSLLIALMHVPTRLSQRYRSRQFALDAAIVVVGAGVLAWDLIIRPTLGGGEQVLSVALRVIYPMIGVMYLACLEAIRSAGGPASHPAAWRALKIGVLAYALGQALYQVSNYGAPGSEYFELTATIPYLIGYLAMLWSFGLLGEPSAQVASTDGSLPRPSRLPTLVTAGVATVLIWRGLEHWQVDATPLAFGLIVLAVLLLVRENSTATENDRLLRAEIDREGEARMAAMVQHVGDLILLIDPDSTIRFASHSAHHILQLGRERQDSRQFAAHVHPEDRAALTEAIGAASNEQRATTLRVGAPGQQRREMDLIVTDLRHEPAVGGIVVVGRDLSDRRELELRLQQAEKLEAVGKLAGGIAHDFNNLLTTILAEAELLLVEDPTNEGLRALRESATMGADLTRQLLTFARRQVPAARPIDLIELASTSLRMLGKLDTHIRLEFSAPDAVPLVDADPQQMRQALLNLLFNARDAMPDGGTLSVSVETVTLTTPLEHAELSAPAGSYIRLRVQDTGVGMEPSVVKRAFEPFFTTKAFGRGTGLGLPSVLGILQQHHAGLRVHSVQGEGTTIEIYLPESAQRDEDPSTEPPATQLGAIRGTEHLLLVDDEAAVRDVTRRMLERLGYEVRTAASGGEARRALSDNWVPDLLVTDVAMPEETGPQLAAALRQTLPSLPILYISGYTAGELTNGGDLGEAMAFVSKPYTPSELGLQVRALLDRQDPI